MAIVALALASAGCADERSPSSTGRETTVPATTAASTTPEAVTPSGSTRPVAPGFLSTRGAEIVDGGGATVELRAVNWFGLETNSCMPHGLWQRSLDDIVDEIAAAGFDALRLPFANQCLTARPSGLDATQNPTLVGKTSLDVMDALVAAAKARGMKVLLDRHRPDVNAQSELWYTAAYSEKRWIDDWVMLAERYANEPTVIGADLHNEPHGAACWGCGDPKRDWAAAATRAGNAILAANPNWLIVIEGVERSEDGTTTWWGGGLKDVANTPITLSIANRVVYSPHEYPASIFAQPWFSDPNFPDNLPARWDEQWGYIAKQGIAPVLIGEFGTRLATESDTAWLATLVNYIDEEDLSFAYWSWNPNSGDTGGLVKDDWATPETAKLTALAPLLR